MTKNIFSFLLLTLLVGGLLLTGCNGRKQTAAVCDSSKVKVWKVDTTAYIRQDKGTPSCKITLKLPFLQGTDSVSIRVNQNIQEKAFGPAYAQLSPAQFIKAFTDTLISYHQADVAMFLEEDLKYGEKPAEWYNYEFDLEAQLTAGLSDSIWNYVLTDYRQTGGAHPNTLKTYLNIEAATGKVLTKRDVFSPNADEALTPAIIKSLANHLNHLEGQDLHVEESLKGLQDAGLFLERDPYLPENFLLGKNTVTFYYNRYEIACYAAGDFEVTLPLDDVKKYFIKRK